MDFFKDVMLGDVSMDIKSSTISQFKQCPKLFTAIEKLYNDIQPSSSSANRNEEILPDRRLDFHEVRKLVKEKILPQDSLPKDPHMLVILEEVNEKKKLIMEKIELILNNINTTSDQGGTPKFMVRNQRLWSNCIYDLDRVTLKSSAEAKKTVVSYSATETKTRFNAIVFVLTKVHELLTKNLTVTRRELFYQNVVRFRNQSNLDVAVRDVCCLLECPPWELGVVATAKGLVAGPLAMVTSDGKTVDCTTSGGTLIPQDVIGIKYFKSEAKYILVVEKDAIFQKLLDEGALLRLGPVIIITGKGYPDVCTRQLLVRLTLELRLRALALVDADPHGYEIFLTYKYGSLAQSHLSRSLACRTLALLGARYKDVITLAPEAARLRLTDRDRSKINFLLKRPYLDTAMGKSLSEDLRAMLARGVKSELEALASISAALCDAYLPAKIIEGDFLG